MQVFKMCIFNIYGVKPTMFILSDGAHVSFVAFNQFHPARTNIYKDNSVLFDKLFYTHLL